MGVRKEKLKLTDGTLYRSDEEVYFSWWLEEAKKAGYIEWYTYEKTIINLFEGLKPTYKKMLPTRIKEDSFTLLTPRIYTPDFEIAWTKQAEGILYSELDCGLPKDKRAYFGAQKGVSLVEIKPNFDSNNMTMRVKVLVDWAWDKHKQYIQIAVTVPKVSKGKVSPSNCLFVETFVPERYLMTDGAKQARKINFNFKILPELVAERSKDGHRRV